MKILQVISSFPPAYSYGGPARMAYETSKHLVKRGHDVTVYTTDVYDSKSRLKYGENPMIMDGIKVYHFRNISNSLAKNNLCMAPQMAIALSKNINKYDIVHVNEYRTIQAKFVQYYCKKHRTPYVLQPRGTAPTISKSKQKIIFDSLFGNDIIKYASKIIATSRIESDQYQNVFTNFNFNKVVHIPNPIDIETYIQLPKKGEFKKKYHIDANEKIILFLSRIHERKGADILIEAFSDLKKDTGFVKLIIAGPDEGYLHKLKTIARNLNVQDDVIFPGPLYEMNKLEAFVDADVFVLPAKDQYESFGNVVLEALMCSTPVVITSNCGISEWIESDMGHVIEYDTNQLKVALADILKNTYSKEAFIDIKERLIAKFEWVNIIEKIESVYNLSKKDAITYI